MKNIFALAIILTISLVSCDSKDDFTGDSKVDFKVPTATYAIVGNNLNMTVDESLIDPEADEVNTITGDYRYGVYLVEATLSEAVQFDTFIDITQTGGSASGSDFSTTRIKVPALQTVGYGKIMINQTGDEEGDETLAFTTNTNSANVNGSETFSFDITGDFLNPDFMFSVGWCGEYEYEVIDDATITGNFEDAIDLDVYVFDSDFNNTGIGAGATSGCPEEISFADLPNGIYYVAIDVYANNLSSFGIGESIDVEMLYGQEFFTATTPLIHNFNLNTDTASGLTPVAQVEKIGPQEYVVTAM